MFYKDNMDYQDYMSTFTPIPIYNHDFYVEMHQMSYGCEHYRNRCKIICPKCPNNSNIYSCHKCHEEEMNDKLCSGGGLGYHDLSAKEIKYFVCDTCNFKQEFSGECKKCSTVFCTYICHKCRLMDNRSSSDNYYHCHKCNCCLIGNNNNFKHCDKCNTCIGKMHYDRHVCRQDNFINDKVCSVCQTNTKSFESIIMKCSHVLHKHCFDDLIKTTYKCPECKKSIIDTSLIFARIEEEIRRTPLNPELQKKIKIKCNDCCQESEVDFHFLGNRCPKFECKSFNTYEL